MSVITASCVPRPPSVRVFPLPPVSDSDCRHSSVTAGGHCLSLLTVAANMNLKVSDGSSRESEDVAVMIWNVSHVCMSPGQGAGVTLAGRHTRVPGSATSTSTNRYSQPSPGVNSGLNIRKKNGRQGEKISEIV